MTSQPDLLNSNSFAGGFQISTQVTPANANGVAWNQSATISLNNGATTVTMNNDGQASIATNGQSVSIGRGETMRLGNGESVTCEENGSLRVTAENGNGGRIETTLTAQGKGVNVDVTAHDVDLGGRLVDGYERRAPGPVPSPIPSPGPHRSRAGLPPRFRYRSSGRCSLRSSLRYRCPKQPIRSRRGFIKGGPPRFRVDKRAVPGRAFMLARVEGE